MRRRLFTILSAMSLLLCVVVVVLWVRSCWRSDSYRRVHRWSDGDATSGYEWYVHSHHGRLVSEFGSMRRFPSGRVDPSRIEDDLDNRFWFGTTGAPEFRSPDWWGFVYRHDVGDRMSPAFHNWRVLVREVHREVDVGVPYAAPALLFAVLPALYWMRRPRPRSGLCPACGYDLRATPDRCPECGHQPAKIAPGTKP